MRANGAIFAESGRCCREIDPNDHIEGSYESAGCTESTQIAMGRRGGNNDLPHEQITNEGAT